MEIDAETPPGVTLGRGAVHQAVYCRLKRRRQYTAHEAYYYVCRNRVSNKKIWREELQIDNAFAPLDDFWF